MDNLYAQNVDGNGSLVSSKVKWLKRATQWLLLINVISMQIIFRKREFEDKSIDFQILLKLGVWFFTFCYALFLYRLWVNKLLRVDNVLQIALLGLIAVSSFYAPNFSYSAASSFSLITVVFLMILCSQVLTNNEIVLQIILGCTFITTGSVIVYFVNPDFGRMYEWQNGVFAPGKRLSGLSGNANSIGYISAIALLSLYYYKDYFTAKIPPYYWIAILINLSALLLSNSRTSLAALVVSILTASLIKPTPLRLAIFAISVCTVIAVFSFVDIDTLFSMVSRSGNVSEITTGTGRTKIWQAVSSLIAQRPLFGWGYASSNFILPPITAEMDDKVTHAHNAYLQVALSIGYVGLFLFVAVLASKLYFSVRSRQQLNTAYIVYLLLAGITEPVSFQGIANATTLVLATVLALNYEEIKKK